MFRLSGFSDLSSNLLSCLGRCFRIATFDQLLQAIECLNVDLVSNEYTCRFILLRILTAINSTLIETLNLFLQIERLQELSRLASPPSGSLGLCKIERALLVEDSFIRLRVER